MTYVPIRMKDTTKVVTRFPPSPTGNLHIGGARTALFNYLFTKHHGGKIYLRMENTDEERSKPEYEKNILTALEWLGFSFDPVRSREGTQRFAASNGVDVLPEDGKPFWRQSERKDVYRAHLKKLVDEGKAYVSKETPTPSQSPPSLPPSRQSLLRKGGMGGEGNLPQAKTAHTASVSRFARPRCGFLPRHTRRLLHTSGEMHYTTLHGSLYPKTREI